MHHGGPTELPGQDTGSTDVGKADSKADNKMLVLWEGMPTLWLCGRRRSHPTRGAKLNAVVEFATPR